MQVHGDRVAILKLLSKLPASERKLLPEVQQTADALYARATDLARTLHAMDTNLDSRGPGPDRRADRGFCHASRTIRSGPGG